MSWTDERIDQLKQMWERGMTASQIAEELGGVSRNAVIGKAHRLGLQARPSPVKATDSTPKAAPQSRKTAAPAESAAPRPVAKPKEKPAPVVAAEPRVAAPVSDAGLRDIVLPVVPATPQPRIVSVGPGGFLRQGPGELQQPIPPAPPRRLVPAKPSADLQMASWPPR
jgi:GcrA cell cycle regulator